MMFRINSLFVIVISYAAVITLLLLPDVAIAQACDSYVSDVIATYDGTSCKESQFCRFDNHGDPNNSCHPVQCNCASGTFQCKGRGTPDTLPVGGCTVTTSTTSTTSTLKDNEETNVEDLDIGATTTTAASNSEEDSAGSAAVLSMIGTAAATAAIATTTAVLYGL
jgi:hypothetical protein